MKLAIKKARLLAHVTQAQIAKSLGVSEATYKSWEAREASVPKPMQTKLAKKLSISTELIEGQPEPFDLCGLDGDSVPDTRRYFGEIAVHFISGSPPLLLPISEDMRTSFCHNIELNHDFIDIQSLDNRFVLVRRKAIADIYLSSDAYDDYGPDENKYGDQHLGIFPDDSFWKIVEYLDSPEDILNEFSQKEIDNVTKRVSKTEADLDELVAKGRILAQDRDKVRKDANDITQQFVTRACDISWQLTGGKQRSITVKESISVWASLGLLNALTEKDCLFLDPVEYHRTIIVPARALDYISMPTHKFIEGMVQNSAQFMHETL